MYRHLVEHFIVSELTSDNVGQSPSTLGRRRGILADLSKFPPQVLAFAVLRDFDREKCSRLERPSESFGDPGHLFRVANWLIAIEQLLVASTKGFGFGPVVAQLLGASWLAGCLSQLD